MGYIQKKDSTLCICRTNVCVLRGEIEEIKLHTHQPQEHGLVTTQPFSCSSKHSACRGCSRATLIPDRGAGGPRSSHPHCESSG